MITFKHFSMTHIVAIRIAQSLMFSMLLKIISTILLHFSSSFMSMRVIRFYNKLWQKQFRISIMNFLSYNKNGKSHTLLTQKCILIPLHATFGKRMTEKLNAREELQNIFLRTWLFFISLSMHLICKNWSSNPLWIPYVHI